MYNDVILCGLLEGKGILLNNNNGLLKSLSIAFIVFSETKLALL